MKKIILLITLSITGSHLVASEQENKSGREGYKDYNDELFERDSIKFIEFGDPTAGSGTHDRTKRTKLFFDRLTQELDAKKAAEIQAAAQLFGEKRREIYIEAQTEYEQREKTGKININLTPAQQKFEIIDELMNAKGVNKDWCRTGGCFVFPVYKRIAFEVNQKPIDEVNEQIAKLSANLHGIPYTPETSTPGRQAHSDEKSNSSQISFNTVLRQPVATLSQSRLLGMLALARSIGSNPRNPNA